MKKNTLIKLIGIIFSATISVLLTSAIVKAQFGDNLSPLPQFTSSTSPDVYSSSVPFITQRSFKKPVFFSGLTPGKCVEIASNGLATTSSGACGTGSGSGGLGWASTTVPNSNSIYSTALSNVGIGTTSPYARLSVVGETVSSYFTATSTTATSTFANGLNITGGCFAISGTCFSGGSGTPGGLNTQVQFNDSSIFGGDTSLTWDKTNDILTVAGNRILSTGTNNLFFGNTAGNLTTSGIGGNAGIGKNALTTLSTGAYNIAIGNDAGKNITTGNYLTCIGFEACLNYTDGQDSIGIGYQALRLTNQSTQIAIGSGALATLTTGATNLAIGANAGGALTTGGNNIAVGFDALQFNQTGSQNTMIGVNAGKGVAANNPSENTAVGYSAGSQLTTATHNIMLGAFAGQKTSSGGDNVYIGYGAALEQTAAVENTVIGTYAGWSGAGSSFARSTLLGKEACDGLSSGSNNLCLGWRTGRDISTGAHNITIGYNINSQGGATASNGLNIGNFLYGSGIDATGSTVDSDALFGVGTSTPASRVEIYGTSGISSLSVASSTGANQFKIDRFSRPQFVTAGIATLDGGSPSSVVVTPGVPIDSNTLILLTGQSCPGAICSAYNISATTTSTFTIQDDDVGISDTSTVAWFIIQKN